jgi:kynurenine 3-monooxygenase
MKSASHPPVNIVGAGLAGALLALLLARRGYPATLYERRPDPRQSSPERGRSINLALAARGTRALERAGVLERIRPLLIPMRGRMVHELSGKVTLQAYGQREHEVIYSVGRADLNRVLIEEAVRHAGVSVEFNQQCVGADPARNVLRLRHQATGSEREVALAPTVAADGAGSAVRSSLAARGLVTVREEWLDHDYKEFTIPAAGGSHALQREALHIWPRGGFMLIALPNTDGSFTATLFLARSGGRASFEALSSTEAAAQFLAREFPDAVALMPDIRAEFARNPQGQLGSVHAAPWHLGGQLLLLGDAAHAIVPFHGQGMNAAFEDCVQLDALLAAAGPDVDLGWEEAFARFEELRRPNAAAIAQMAVENYTEMRDTVLDGRYLRGKAIAMGLERRFPDRFIPRYSMVMFHPEIPYAEALRRGGVQAQILAELDAGDRGAGAEPSTAAESPLAARLVSERLAPIP